MIINKHLLYVVNGLLSAILILLLYFATPAHAQSDEEVSVFEGRNCVGQLTRHYAQQKHGLDEPILGIRELQKSRAVFVKFGDIKGESDSAREATKKKVKEIVVVGSKAAQQIIACVEFRQNRR